MTFDRKAAFREGAISSRKAASFLMQPEFHGKAVIGEIRFIFANNESMKLTIDIPTTVWHIKSRLFSLV
jgi:hypothetical protein